MEPTANVNEKVSSVEDLIEYSRNLGINLPKSHLETLRVFFDRAETSALLVQNVDTIAEKYKEKGFKWYVQTDHDPKYPLMRFMDKYGHTMAYVAERVNKETQERFFVANRINEKGEHLQLSSSSDIEAIKGNVTAYYTGAVIREIANEFSKLKNPETPSATQESNNQKPPELSLSR